MLKICVEKNAATASLIPNWRKSSSSRVASGNSVLALAALNHLTAGVSPPSSCRPSTLTTSISATSTMIPKNGTTVPQDNALIQRVQQQIQSQVQTSQLGAKP